MYIYIYSHIYIKIYSHTSRFSYQRAKSKLSGRANESMNPVTSMEMWRNHAIRITECLRLIANVNVKLMSRCLMSHRSSEYPGFFWSGTLRISDLWEIWPLLTALVSFLICSTEDASCKPCIIVIFFCLPVTLSLYLTTFPQKLHWSRGVSKRYSIWCAADSELFHWVIFDCFRIVLVIFMLWLSIGCPLLDPMFFIVWNST